MFKLPSLALSAALLAGCGVVPLPGVGIPDQTLELPSSVGFEQYVVYDGSDAFAGTSISSLLSQVQIRGQAQYSGAGNLSEAVVYLRSSLPSCSALPGSGTQLCAVSGESAQKIGTLTLKHGQVTSFQLSGTALDQAAKAGHGYFGVQAVSGASVTGDRLKLSTIKASAKL